MGIVQRQSIISTIVNFVGVIVGAVSLLYIYPLDNEFYGFLQFLYNTALFLVPFASLGLLSIIVKFYPQFKNPENGNNGFLTIILGTTLLGILVFFFGVTVFKSLFYHFLGLLSFDVSLMKKNEVYIGVLTIITIYIYAFQYYAIGYKRIVVPNFIHPFLLKFFLPALVLGYHFKWMNTDESAFLLIVFLSFVLLLLVGYTKSQNQLKFTWNPEFITPVLRKKITTYTFYGSLNTIGSVLAFRIDAIMISLLLGLESNGQYFLIYFIAGIVEIPMRSMNQISSTLIAEFFENNRLKEIENLYKKTANNLFIAGSFIFLLIWFTMDDIFQLSVDPSKFIYGKQIFLFLGLAKLVDMLTSVNTYIIIYSKYFRYNVLFVLILGITNVILNYVLIGRFDLVGAAMATCIAVVLFNIIKLIFIYIKFKMLPFSKGVFKVFLISGITYVVATFIPAFGSHLVNIFLHSVIIALLFGSLIIAFKVSEDINSLLVNVWSKIKKRD